MKIAIERESVSNQMVGRRVITKTFEPGAPIESWDQRTFEEGHALEDTLTRMAANVAGHRKKAESRTASVDNLAVSGERNRLTAQVGLDPLTHQPTWLTGEAHPKEYPSFRETYRIGTGRFHGETVTVFERTGGLYDTTQWLVHAGGGHTMIQTYGEDCSS